MQLTVVQTPISNPDGKQHFGTDMDAILGVIWKEPNEQLSEFSGKISFIYYICYVLTTINNNLFLAEMWYNVFLWAMFSSIFIHSIAAVIAFLTLRKHAVGRYIPRIKKYSPN